MKVFAAIKQVGAIDDEVALGPDGRDVKQETLERSLNEWDAFTVEQALQMCEQDDAGEVVAVTVGREGADEVLRTALAMGAARAVRIDAEVDPADPLTVAHLLAAAVERESPQFVLCGAQSSDAMNGATGGALAGVLGWPHVAIVRAIENGDGGDALVVERELEGGLAQRLRVSGPVLLTLQSGINQPRYANLRAIKRAEAMPLDVLTVAELGLDPAKLERDAGARTIRMRVPEKGSGAQLLGGDPEQIASRIAELIEEGVRT